MVVPPNQLFSPIELADTRLGLFSAGEFNQDIDAKLLSAHIKPTESLFLVPLLGYELYEDLISKRLAVKYVPETGNPAFPPVDMFPLTEVAYNNFFNKFLWRYFGATLSFRLQLAFTAVLTNEGLNSSEKAANTSLRRARADMYNQNIDALRSEIVRYLCKNKADFPLWSGKYSESCEDCGGCNADKNTPKEPGFSIYWS